MMNARADQRKQPACYTVERFPDGASRLAALRRRSQPAWLLPPRALPAGRRAPETVWGSGRSPVQVMK